jgi:serine protease Do
MKSALNTLCWLAVAGSLGLAVPSASAKDSSAIELARQLNTAFIEVADKVSSSVVVIRVAHKPNFGNLDDDDNPFFDMLPKQWRKQFEEDRQRKQKSRQEPVFDGQGSGVVIREDGYILTNRHVVDGAEKIKVRLKDGNEYDAEVRGVDAQSDIAVLKINAKGLTTAKLADSSKTRVGEFAIAIGAPFSLDYSVTFGHVSAKGRSNIIQDRNMDQDFIQTDANINPGNSGGPLVNIDGEVIGINTLIRGMRTGIGFAIPSNLAREVSDKLISDGRYTRARLGIMIQALTEYLNEYPEFREYAKGTKEGVVVKEITPDGPAAKSDLKAADIIVAVDGRPVRTPQELKNEVRAKKIGLPVTLDVMRSGKLANVKVKTEEWPDENMPVASKRLDPTENDTGDLGLTVKTLTKDLATEYGVKVVEGVIVVNVERDHPNELKVKPGDIITEINSRKVANPKQFRDALKEGGRKKGYVVHLISEGISKFEMLKGDE